MSDEPLVIRRPRRILRAALGLYLLAVVSAIGAGYFGALLATRQANVHTDRRITVLERDLEQRRVEREKALAEQERLLDAYRRDHCAVLARLPQDPPIVEQRARYGCPPPPQQPSRQPTPPAGRAPSQPPARRPPGSTAARPPPSPGPPGPPGPAGPAGPPLVALLCLPILGICL